MGLLKRTQSVFRDFMALIYPNFCLSCGETVYKNESVICLKCLYALPRTNFHTDKENPCNKIFWGKVKIEQATAFCFFEQKGKVQKMIHELKYKGKREVGYLLGKRMGEEIKQTPPFNAVDYVVPVPLHPDKYKKRGYNQSEEIAKGLAEGLKTNISANNLSRTIFTSTQTKKSHYERWENVGDVFHLNHPEKFKGKHILLTDDVMTTGSTIEACANAILKSSGAKVSVAAIAYTK